MARQLHQLSSVQEGFATRIKEKVHEEREAAQERVADRLPFVGKLLAPVAGLVFDVEQGVNQFKGDRGEERVCNRIIAGMPDTWVIFQNAVIEPEPDTFAQIDNLVIGPPGIFLVETKAWQGSYTAYRDTWKRREGRRWTPCASPTKQAIRHAILMRKWLGQFWTLSLPEHANRWIHPLVVFTHAEWLGIKDCTVPVFDGSRALVKHLKAQTDQHLAPNQIDAIADLVICTPAPPPAREASKPLPQPVRHAQRPVQTEVVPPVQGDAPQTPLCPRCGIPMLVRTARTGARAGQQFYGCKNFPSCREMKPLERAGT
jgi:hypothetical protein